MEIGLPRGLFVASARARLQVVGGFFGGEVLAAGVFLCGKQVMELIFKEICLCCKSKA